MDEVDLILHPLRSELNFPIGPKEPLDLTQNKVRFARGAHRLTPTRCQAGKGLRYEIPMHLLDAMFYATTGFMTVPLHQSREAELILRKIKRGELRGWWLALFMNFGSDPGRLRAARDAEDAALGASEPGLVPAGTEAHSGRVDAAVAFLQAQRRCAHPQPQPQFGVWPKLSLAPLW